MTLGAGATPIAAVPAQPPRYGLIAAAPVNPPGVAELRWQTGVKWEPEQCGESSRFAVGCLGESVELVPADQAPFAGAEPFGIAASDECSPFGFGARDFGGRARRQLEATQSFEIANEFWTGSLSASAGLSNRSLVDSASDTLSNGPMAELAAFACLEQGLAVCGRGRRGMIHVTPEFLVNLVTNSTVRIEGGVFVSPLGNIVVADAGYDGSGPGGSAAGASQWAYATGMVAVLLSPPVLSPPNLSTAQAWAEATDRAVNTVTVWAQKVAAVLWDECCHLAVEVDLPACLMGGAS